MGAPDTREEFNGFFDKADDMGYYDMDEYQNSDVTQIDEEMENNW